VSATVYVARHGETTWNLAGRYQGRRESGLTGLGMRQGMALAQAFTTQEPRIERIIASPLVRCAATAQFVAERLNLPLEADVRLIEIAHGTWEGRLRDEIAANDPETFRAWKERPADVSFDGGETVADVRDRWRDFASTLATDVPTLVVTHDAVVRIALLEAACMPLDDLWNVAVENAAYAMFSVNDGEWTISEACVNAHLAGLRADTEAQAL
jgi:broad specificity phosphatase PhoE